MRKFIFLDFDGVLNSHTWFKSRGPCGGTGTSSWEDHDICPDGISQLNDLVSRSGAEVVVSSSWRLGNSLPELRDILQRNGFCGKVVGMTPARVTPTETGVFRADERGFEIQAWLDTNTPNEDVQFVILDDGSDMAHLKDHLVQTDLNTGLCAHDVARALLLLDKSNTG